MGASTRLKPMTFCSFPSSKTLKLAGLRPGTNWWVFSSSTPTSTVTSGTSICSETGGIPWGVLILGAVGAGGGGAVSSTGCSFFLGTAMGPLSDAGPPLSGVAAERAAGAAQAAWTGREGRQTCSPKPEASTEPMLLGNENSWRDEETG